jgi:hypothetical protein
MESVWRRYCDFTVESKRSNLGVDCTCPYNPYGHVAGPYHHADVVEGCGALLLVGFVQSCVDTCHWQQIKFGHVAQPIGATCHYSVGLCGWLICKSFGSPRGSTLGPPLIEMN